MGSQDPQSSPEFYWGQEPGWVLITAEGCSGGTSTPRGLPFAAQQASEVGGGATRGVWQVRIGEPCYAKDLKAEGGGGWGHVLPVF